MWHNVSLINSLQHVICVPMYHFGCVSNFHYTVVRKAMAKCQKSRFPLNQFEYCTRMARKKAPNRISPASLCKVSSVFIFHLLWTKNSLAHWIRCVRATFNNGKSLILSTRYDWCGEGWAELAGKKMEIKWHRYVAAAALNLALAQ